MTHGPNLIMINVGNSRIQVGRAEDGAIVDTARFLHAEVPAVLPVVQNGWKAIADRSAAAILLASVNDEVADRLVSLIEDQLSVTVYRLGTDVPVPIGEQLDPETITGIDRLLNAAAAYDAVQQACIIVDAGTAVTIDFVDGDGTFHGGAIAPGAAMQLRAMHEHTDALPELTFAAPEDEAFGRSTAQAMLQGVFHGIRGLTWKLTERYAEAYGAYPQIVATGGDAATIFQGDELVDNVVPDLTLRGIMVAARHAMIDSDAPRDAGSAEAG